jgi:hypothetical protein
MDSGQVSWLPDHCSPVPSQDTVPVAHIGFAPRSQWRDRAGLSPASHFRRRLRTVVNLESFNLG